MLATAEVRWFVEGPLPKEAKAWIKKSVGAQAAEPVRTDRYVRTTADDLGVKVRENKIEAKRRSEALGLYTLGATEGSVETWCKWSFALAADAQPPDWTAVRKKRWLVKFRVKGDVPKKLKPTARVGARANGVNVELTVVKLKSGKRWWSVCLESFGPGEKARRDALRIVAAHVFKATPPPALTAGASMGYPAWLLTRAD